MYHAELAVLKSALTEERDNRARFGMDTSTLDAILNRAEAVEKLDPETLATLVEGVQSLVADQRNELVSQLDALNELS